MPPSALQREAPDVTVFIAARHESIRAALWHLLEGEPGIEPLAATADLTDMVSLLGWLRPAVVVVEQSVLGLAGLDALATLVEVAPQAAFIVVGMQDHPGYVAWARAAGAVDYVCLDEAVDRLGPSVMEAAAPGAEPIVPPSNSRRLRTLTSPTPSKSWDLSNL